MVAMQKAPFAWEDKTRAAILAVALWLEDQGIYANHAAAGYLRQELLRHG